MQHTRKHIRTCMHTYMHACTCTGRKHACTCTGSKHASTCTGSKHASTCTGSKHASRTLDKRISTRAHMYTVYARERYSIAHAVAAEHVCM